MLPKASGQRPFAIHFLDPLACSILSIFHVFARWDRVRPGGTEYGQAQLAWPAVLGPTCLIHNIHLLFFLGILLQALRDVPTKAIKNGKVFQ